MEATPMHLQVIHLTACIFSVFSLVVWLVPSLNGVSKIRLTLYFLLCQLLSCVVHARHLAVVLHSHTLTRKVGESLVTHIMSWC